MIWRLVFRKVATYGEICEKWSIMDLCHANEGLDLQDDADWIAQQEASRKAGL
jgi:hypothetical protein